ncbi:DNA topoisomerase 2-binding protein 1 [Musca domestica]|uniref:DNA topoisomerase 2-binding protein 1 n=1 Tax=Musca domestica TaxID=7370 RepID=A0A1I8M7G4_MUSDO|nr:DNA topoisomerase 2-binding protein 1 [Musca domestica]XP_011293164.1 DNA topoisomerase 2-binding protein 1 [Musca domestica]XP_011293165.1 DNA topoisomerase 2-binding protein 1 [Musca domestica]
MSLDDSINAYFVTTINAATNDSDEKAIKDFKKSLTYLQNHIPEENIRQIKASEGFPLIASGRLTKKDVFIFDRFEGDFFQQLQQTKSLIIGPPCLTQCLLNEQQIPLGTSPVFTCAMRDLQISATGITAQEKDKLKNLIQWMGGHYFQNFGRSVTHLISNTIKSTKYEHATLNGIPVMHVDWVQRVWERSCAAQVSATDEEFDKYKLPIFFGTNITCTGLDSEKKDKVMRLVNENGGTYHRAFRSQLVDIVITEKNKTNSEKYAAAVRYKKDILSPEWIFDSVQKGFALPTKPYQIKSLKVSTPTKTDQSLADFTVAENTDISRISTAGTGRRANSDMTTVNDTICSNLNESHSSGPTFVAPINPVSKDLKKDLLKKAGAGTHYRLVYEEICPKQAKKAGNFLDGCCIYLSGFRPEEREKLNRILNAGGATRYDVVNEKITHIIVGQLDDSEFKAWKRDNILTGIHIVRLDWLLESIKIKQTASEAVYRVSLPTSREPDAPSPSSKKTLRSMNHSFKQPDKPIKKKLFSKDAESDMDNDSDAAATPKNAVELPSEAEENDLISQYSQENVPQAPPPLPQNVTILPDESMSHPMASSTQCTPNEPPTKAKTPAATSAAPQAQPSNVTDASGFTIDYENLDFFQGMSLYIDNNHFPEEFYTQMISECEAAQGNIVPATFRDPVDYAIVSFESTLDVSKLPVKARNIVTELYVESCMKVNKLVPIEYYHKHIPHTADMQPLQGMTIVISIYSLLERDFIDSIAQLLGANVNKTFVKKERPLLICPNPEGSKYEGALKWRYPVVTSEWLLKCAEEGRKVSYGPFLVGDSPEDFPLSPTLRERNTTNSARKTVDKNTPATPINQPPPQPQYMDVDGVENNQGNATLTDADNNLPAPETFTPLRNKRVSELAGPGRVTRQSLGGNTSLTGPESPHTPTNNYAKASYNFDFMENILAEIENEEERECLREVINEMKNNQTPELERIRRQACTPINRKVPTPKGIPDFCTTPEFEKRMADEFERRWRLPTKKMKPDTPIDEIRKRVLRATCKAMGIPYSDDDEEKASSSRKSLASKSNSNLDTTPLNNKSLRSASAIAPRAIFGQNNTPDHQKTVSTFNIPANETRKSDTFIPNTQSPNTSAANRRSITQSSPSGLGQRASLGGVGKSTINFDKISFEETNVEENAAGAATTSNATATTTRPSLPTGASPEIKQITDYLRNCDSRRQSLKRTRLSSDQQQSTLQSMETEAHYVQPFESEQLQTEDMVGWRDPTEFHAQRKARQVAPSMQYQGTPRFSISCSDEETRDDIISKILQLGGEVCENLVNFDPECTHFVCEKPNRGEKMLGCISSGKWVLSLKYIEECFAKDVFIDEELYEWGNCKALNLPQLTADEQVIATAAHRWRKDLSGTILGAFTGIRAILRISNRNVDALKNVIKAGKGEIVEATAPYSSCAKLAATATHCFVDVKKCPLDADDYEFLKNHDVFVLTQMYINAFLMNGPDVDRAKYEIHM